MLALERLLGVLIALIMVTQVVVPVLANKRIFWLFRKSTYTQRRLRKAQRAEVEAQQELVAAQHEARALELKQQAEAAKRTAVNSYLDDKLH
jgi:hypothetical protein